MRALPKRAWLAAFVAAAGGLWSCAGAPGADVGDAGHDGPDAVVLDVLDAGHDGPDAVVLDVLGDSPDAPPTPEWVPVEGFPAGCVLERASDPASIVSAHWEPCPEVAAGCEMLRFDRVPGALDSVIHAGAGNGHPRAFVAQSYTGEIGSLEHVYWTLLDEGGRARAAWRYPTSPDVLCIARPTATASSAVVLMRAGTGPAFDAWLLRGTMDDIGGGGALWWRSTTSSVPPAQHLQYASLSESTYAVGLDPRGFVLVIEGDRWAHVAGPTLPRAGGADAPAVVGHHVFFEWTSEDLTTQEIQVATVDTPARTLYTAPGDRVIAFVVSDGTWIAWRAAIRPAMAGDVIDFTELWVAPYTAEPSDFAPRLVRDDLDSTAQQTIGDGYYTLADGSADVPTYVRVIALSDGSARRLELPPDTVSVGWGVTGRPLWVTRDEVVVPAARRVDGVPEDIVLRIPIAALRSED